MKATWVKEDFQQLLEIIEHMKNTARRNYERILLEITETNKSYNKAPFYIKLFMTKHDIDATWINRTVLVNQYYWARQEFHYFEKLEFRVKMLQSFGVHSLTLEQSEISMICC